LSADQLQEPSGFAGDKGIDFQNLLTVACAEKITKIRKNQNPAL